MGQALHHLVWSKAHKTRGQGPGNTLNAIKILHRHCERLSAEGGSASGGKGAKQSQGIASSLRSSQ